MGWAAYNGRHEVIRRLHAAGGDINFTNNVSVISIGIAAVFSQIVYRGILYCSRTHTGGGWARDEAKFEKKICLRFHYLNLRK